MSTICPGRLVLKIADITVDLTGSDITSFVARVPNEQRVTPRLNAAREFTLTGTLPSAASQKRIIRLEATTSYTKCTQAVALVEKVNDLADGIQDPSIQIEQGYWPLTEESTTPQRQQVAGTTPLTGIQSGHLQYYPVLRGGVLEFQSPFASDTIAGRGKPDASGRTDYYSWSMVILEGEPVNA